MNLFLAAIAWIFNPALQSAPGALPQRILEHLGYTFGATAIAALIAVPLGYYIGHTGRGREIAVAFTGGMRALPSLGVLILIALGLGIGFEAPLLTFVLLAIPPVLSGAYSGLQAIDRRVIEAATAMGMTPLQVLVRVEIPLGLPLLIGGLRAGILQVVATATLAAYVSGGALGGYIFLGIATRNYTEMLGASIVITVLALVLEAVFALIQKFVTPRGVSVLSGRINRAGTPRTRGPLTQQSKGLSHERQHVSHVPD
ncbi:ABC transporter permease [Microterricola viridarii]|uniref:Glycine/betaine ABC transporter permease n=1 Tax=Microterricola viridarii TaxID=412690 RepID=A0A0Y0NKN6_9MICO|nr:ABC transporter permease [Microterricola viridarii]AMB60400.1 glycine/betaine ABC transporter permease [Microterricola viridarii]